MFRDLPFMAQLKELYGTDDDKKKGRLIALSDSLLNSFFNVFITGIFYTGFLSMYGIDLVGVGIITFIPALANCCCIFSPMILERLPRRKGVLLAAKVYFYVMYILATNLMPLFVTDPGSRVVCFGVILFLAYAVYAVFSPGFTPWFYNFFPEDGPKRARYISYNQIFSSLMSSAVLLLSGVLSAAVRRSGNQNELILTLRYFAFALVLADVWLQSRAREYPYGAHAGKVRLREVFTLSLRHRKFMYCMLLIFAWCYIANLNSGIWNYHLLNNIGFSYTRLQTMSACYTGALFLLMPLWRRILGRLSWVRTFAVAMLLWVPTELIAFFLSPATTWIYVPMSLLQQCISVGLNLSYANIFYMNLPRENAITHTCFHAVFANLFTFLGLMTGTLFCKLMEGRAYTVLGVQILPVQLTTIGRAVTMLALALVLLRAWRSMTPESELEAMDALRGKKGGHGETGGKEGGR